MRDKGGAHGATSVTPQGEHTDSPYTARGRSTVCHQVSKKGEGGNVRYSFPIAFDGMHFINIILKCYN